MESYTSDLPKGTVYISGPMSGYPDFNYPAFREAEKRLIQKGQKRVVSPAQDSLVVGNVPWHECLKLALTQMMDCDGVVLLEGWEKSKGAQLEVHVARSLLIPVYELEEYIHEFLGNLKEKTSKGAKSETDTLKEMLTGDEDGPDSLPRSPRINLETRAVSEDMAGVLANSCEAESLFASAVKYLDQKGIGSTETDRLLLAAEIEGEVLKKTGVHPGKSMKQEILQGIESALRREYGKTVSCAPLQSLKGA